MEQAETLSLKMIMVDFTRLINQRELSQWPRLQQGVCMHLLLRWWNHVVFTISQMAKVVTHTLKQIVAVSIAMASFLNLKKPSERAWGKTWAQAETCIRACQHFLRLLIGQTYSRLLRFRSATSTSSLNRWWSATKWTLIVGLPNQSTLTTMWLSKLREWRMQYKTFVCILAI